MNCVNWGRIQIAFGFTWQFAIVFWRACIIYQLEIVIYGYLCEIFIIHGTLSLANHKLWPKSINILPATTMTSSSSLLAGEIQWLRFYHIKEKFMYTMRKCDLVTRDSYTLYEIMSSWLFQWKWMHISKNNVYRKVISFLCHECGEMSMCFSSFFLFHSLHIDALFLRSLACPFGSFVYFQFEFRFCAFEYKLVNG